MIILVNCISSVANVIKLFTAFTDIYSHQFKLLFLYSCKYCKIMAFETVNLQFLQPQILVNCASSVVNVLKLFTAFTDIYNHKFKLLWL